MARMPIRNRRTGEAVDAEQMDKFWLRKKIDELGRGDAAQQQFARDLRAKWEAGQLRGRVYYTDVLDATPQQTRMVEIDYGTELPW